MRRLGSPTPRHVSTEAKPFGLQDGVDLGENVE
jgi:hypothetical protein